MDNEQEINMENLCHGCSYKAYYARGAAQHDCNDCGSRRTCQYVPRLGDTVRINCPLWRADKQEARKG